MTIKKILKTFTIITIVLTLVISAILFLMTNKLIREVAKGRVADEIFKEVFDLDIVLGDFLLYQEKRAEQQWKTKHKNILILLEKEVFEDFEKVELTRSLRKKHKDMGVIFEKILALHKNGGTLNIELENRLTSQILLLSQKIALGASGLSSDKSNEVGNLGRMLVVVFVLSIFSFLLIVAVGVWLVIRVVLKPIRKFQEGISVIEKGNLDYKVDTEEKNEIGDLSRSFDKAVVAIKKSRSEINKRVKEQTSEIRKKQKDLEGQQKAVLNVLEDVDEERKKSGKLANDLIKFKLAVDNASDHIVITDIDGSVIYANKAVKKITGFSSKEILGKKVGTKENWGGLMGQEFYEKMWNEVKKKKKVFEGEIKNKRKNGQEYTAYASISPVLNTKNEVVFFVGIERDITKEKEIEKMKSEFVSVASHQLRTPLTGIQWVAERMLKKSKLPKKDRGYMEDIRLSTNRLTLLVNDLLNVSRIEEGRISINPEKIDLVSYLESYFLECTPICEKKNIKMTFEKHPKSLEISADRNAIRNITQSIISNAIEYTPAGGEVKVYLEQKGEKFLFKVADTGIGIPKENQSTIFGKFIRGDNAITVKTDGTGLGLYIVKQAVNLLGGKIWFESEEGKGSTFFVELPLKSKKVGGEKGLA